MRKQKDANLDLDFSFPDFWLWLFPGTCVLTHRLCSGALVLEHHPEDAGKEEDWVDESNFNLTSGTWALYILYIFLWKMLSVTVHFGSFYNKP